MKIHRENTEENCEKMKNMEEKYFFLTKPLIQHVIYFSLHYALQ